MKRTIFALLAAGSLTCEFSGRVLAETTETPDTADRGEVTDNGNPYRAIVARNAFRLKEPLPPPPPPTNAPPPPEQPKVDVKLAGLAEISGVRYAYLMVPDTERPGQFQYPTLTDDPDRGSVRHGSGLEVREINVKGQSVRLVNGGVEATINFKDNGVKAPPAPAAGKPGQPGGNPGNLPKPTVVPVPTGAPGSANASPANSEPMVFSRSRSRANQMENAAVNSGVPATTSSGIPLSVLAASAGGTGGADVSVPTRPIRTTGGGGTSTPATPQVSLEQEYQALLRQRQVADQEGIRLPPIPGLPLPSDPNPH